MKKGFSIIRLAAACLLLVSLAMAFLPWLSVYVTDGFGDKITLGQIAGIPEDVDQYERELKTALEELNKDGTILSFSDAKTVLSVFATKGDVSPFNLARVLLVARNVFAKAESAGASMGLSSGEMEEMSMVMLIACIVVCALLALLLLFAVLSLVMACVGRGVRTFSGLFAGFTAVLFALFALLIFSGNDSLTSAMYSSRSLFGAAASMADPESASLLHFSFGGFVALGCAVVGFVLSFFGNFGMIGAAAPAARPRTVAAPRTAPAAPARPAPARPAPARPVAPARPAPARPAAPRVCSCGTRLDPDAAFCVNCGKRVGAAPAPVRPAVPVRDVPVREDRTPSAPEGGIRIKGTMASSSSPNVFKPMDDDDL